MGIYCYLLVLSGVFVVGDSRLAMVDCCVLHDVGVLCGAFDANDVLFDDFSCVGARIRWELHNARCVRCIVGLATSDMTTRGLLCPSTDEVSSPPARMYELVFFCSPCGCAACRLGLAGEATDVRA